jgi:hypothetical protein
MENNNSQLVLLSAEKLESILYPLINKLNSIEEKLKKEKVKHEDAYYRNTDLKAKFGMSSNTIIKYRESGIIPYTMIGELYLYPKAQFDNLLKKNSNWDLFQNKPS